MTSARVAPPRRRGINSVEIGMRVLRAVVELQGPASLKDIARHAGLPASHAHRYVSSLVNCALLRQDSASGQYDLGPAAIEIGLAGLARQDALLLADAAARALTQATGATSLLAVWSAGGPTVIRWHPGLPPVYTTLSIGSVLPVTTSATGRVFLAFLDPNLLAAALQREGSARLAPPELDALRADIRRRGLATIDGKVIPGLRAYAAPVLSIDNSLVAVMSLVFSDATARAGDAAACEQLIETCRQLSHDLGGN